MAIISALKIGSTVIPVAYNGFTLSENKVWSSDTGRNNNGVMQGTLIRVCKKLEVTLKPVSLADARTIRDLTNDTTKPFGTVYYNDLGQQGSFTGYFGDVSFPVVGTGINNGEGIVNGIKFSVIEQ